MHPSFKLTQKSKKQKSISFLANMAFYAYGLSIVTHITINYYRLNDKELRLPSFIQSHQTLLISSNLYWY